MLLRGERRSRPRVPVRGGGYVFVRGVRQRAEIANLSGSGVAVIVPDGVASGEHVRLAISLDGQTWVELRGRARRGRPALGGFEIGISLSESDPRALAAVEEYCRQVSLMLAQERQRSLYAERMAGYKPQVAPAPEPSSQPKSTRLSDDDLARGLLFDPKKQGPRKPVPGPTGRRIALHVKASAPTDPGKPAPVSPVARRSTPVPVEPTPARPTPAKAGPAAAKARRPGEAKRAQPKPSRPDPDAYELRSLFQKALADLDKPKKK